ncbi:hypothetical protein E2542_SST17587 [Spatholobus suberectus]|nr:hypothetical protein E2542_SST17587 [Spatholobus suberectus]
MGKRTVTQLPFFLTCVGVRDCHNSLYRACDKFFIFFLIAFAVDVDIVGCGEIQIDPRGGNNCTDSQKMDRRIELNIHFWLEQSKRDGLPVEQERKVPRGPPLLALSLSLSVSVMGIQTGFF